MIQESVAHRRIAFFGGSFDPPHLGHLAVARAAREGLGLDEVLFAPVGSQPLKPVGSRAGFEDRVAMTRLAIANEPGQAVSLADAPKPQGAPNYTLDTLRKLKTEVGPGCTVYCLMGADSLAGLRLWHGAAEIPFVASMIVASRPGQALEDLRALLPSGLTMEAGGGLDVSESGVEVWRYSLRNGAGERASLYLLPGLDVAISASEIRDGLKAGSVEQSMVPAAVADYIQVHRLYV